jgi:hypothetical protein
MSGAERHLRRELPKFCGMVLARRCQRRPIRAEGNAEDWRVEAGHRVEILPGIEIPDPNLAIVVSVGQEFAIRAEGYPVAPA